MLFHPFGIVSQDTHPDTAGVSLRTLPLVLINLCKAILQHVVCP